MARVPPFMQIWPAPLVNGHSGSGSPGMWKLCILGASVDHLLLVSQHFSSEVWPCKGVEVFVDRWPDSNRASERVAPLWCDIQMSKVNRFSPMWVNLAWSQQIYTSLLRTTVPRNTSCVANCTLLHLHWLHSPTVNLQHARWQVGTIRLASTDAPRKIDSSGVASHSHKNKNKAKNLS